MSIAKPGRRVLMLIEPDPDVREVIAELVEEAGWRVVRTRDAAEALALLQIEAWDVLLAHAGSVEGSPVLQRARSRYPGARIVLMTAGTALPVSLEADALLLKPFTTRQLRHALEGPGSPTPPTSP
jgi:DNA-binding response OmpR family regulator